MKTATQERTSRRVVKPTNDQVFSVNQMARMYGNVSQRLMNGGMRLDSLRTNSLLRKEEWLEYDQRVVMVARQRLVGVEDLRANGLVKTLGGIGVLISQWEKQSDMTGADVDMSGVSRGQRDSTEFTLVNVPVPVIHKDFEVNIRRLEASRKMGDTIDTTQAVVAARRVADKIEDILFNGLPGNLDGNPLYGYTNHPAINSGVMTGSWQTIGNIFSNVNTMVLASENAKFWGPFIMYVSNTEYAALRAVYGDVTGQSALQRILSAIPSIKEIKATQSLPAGTVALVQMTEDVVDFAIAEDITTVEWDEQGGMINQFKVMAVCAPRIKSDANGHCGITVFSGA